MKYQIKGIETEKFALRMAWLAFQASHAVGLGFLHMEAARNAKEEDLKPYLRNGSAYFDYCAGRMMKLGYHFTEDTIAYIRNDAWTTDYQSFCPKYPDFDALVHAARESFKDPKIEVTLVAE